ncbi:MAG: 5-formyltetrahydrofolate cyclo-ligase [Aquificae bacterium]|nr:5-formyltetrahydrofolate cyclo-ligase [Aquificota bacterium]
MLGTKEELRRELLKKRKSLISDDRTRKDGAILEHLLSLEELRQADKVLLYCAIQGEPDLTPLMETLINSGKKVVLPRVSGKDLELIEVETPSCLVKGSFGIPEPSFGKPVSPEEIDLAVVPGIAFDLRGYRIGFGKGYYDRLLKRVKAPKVGVAYSFQVVECIPADSWDVPIDILITEKEVIRWNRQS